MSQFWNVLKWQLGWEKNADSHLDLPPYTPVYVEPNAAVIADPNPHTIQITWIGHSTYLIQVDGLAILTDPIWSERASPVSWAGPKRVAHPGIRFEDLPPIDAVVISHTHYDHLDLPTVLKLGNAPRYFVQERTNWWFTKRGITNVSELSWWKSATIGSITITAVPAKHFSKRNLWRTNDAGYGGFVIESHAGAIYFAGDTGYDPAHFVNIGQKFPGIRLGLIPIGAYSPRWFMERVHIDPQHAVTVHREIGITQSIGMHWGTFKLTDEPMNEPPVLLAREVTAAGLKPADFVTLKIGETRVFE